MNGFEFARHCAVLISIAVLAACGGGGGAEPPVSTPSGSRQPPATERVDENPAGARLDHRADNYFPMADGDRLVFARSYLDGTMASSVTMEFVAPAVAGNSFHWQETEDGATTGIDYRRTDQGLEVVLPFSSGLPAAATALIGIVLEYAEPFYPVGSVRRLLRRGSYGQDVDGDGVPEGFQFEMTQTFVGFEDYRLAGTTMRAARFRSVVRITAMYSRIATGEYVYTSTEENWFAPGVGLVRSDRRAEDTTSGNVVRAHSLTLSEGTVSGRSVGGSTAGIRVALEHTALIHDAQRNLFYASVPGHVVGSGNRIAIIDPTTGSTTLSPPIGSEPAAMAIAAGGGSIYVGLSGSGEVLRLALPGFTEIARVRLPAPAFYGQMVADQIAVSPVDADVAAVAMGRTGVSPRHGGVALLRNMQLQPQTTQDHTGSNLIVFDAAGSDLYGYNTDTSEFGLRRIEVMVDGLVERQVVNFGGGYYVRHIDRVGSTVLVGNRAAHVPALALAGEISNAEGCRALATGRVVCLGGSFGQASSLVVSDLTSFARLDSIALPDSNNGSDYRVLVPGAAGTVAVREGISHPAGQTATSIMLITDDRLR